MKHLIVLASLPLFGACSLEEQPRDQIPVEEAISNMDNLFLNTVATLYNYIGGSTDGQGLQGTCRGVYDLQTFGSDEAMLPTRGGDWFDGGIWQAMYKHSWNAGHDLPKNAWLYLYKMITLCNQSLETLSLYKSIAGKNYEAWDAEVRAIRAMYYWYLIDLFGDVPLVTTNDVSMNEVTRTPRADVFKFCVEELEYASLLLPATSSVAGGDYYGRVTAPVCMFVLAKLMLNHKVYTGTENQEYYKKCIDYCSEFEFMGYTLESDYTSNFKVYNEGSKENIFTIPMDKHLYSNQQQNLFRSYHYRHAAAYGFTGENGTCATKRVLSIFRYGTENQDNRFIYNYYYGTVYDLNGEEVSDRTGQPLTYYPEEVELDLSGSPYVETAGARMHKYEVDRNAPKDGKLMDNDIVLFRYADVLLMRAEACLRTGRQEEGQLCLDLVRRRVDMPTCQLTYENLLDERLLELCWEGWRRQDLIRFGKYKSLYEGDDAVDESDGHTTVFPIPADVRALNGNLTQNPGY
ncbi:MAG: RagB/SusD family nutrient uptake outer membrane protein [Prevotella sp.]|nr:RagB/SusD family nutrient uptake outer membrane protein [Prevotella sp.]